MTSVRYRELAAALRERIALGDWGTDGALESEAELGRRYGLSRLTVRRALDILRNEGLLASRQGSGWYVSGAPVAHALGAFPTGASALAAVGRTMSRRVLDYAFAQSPQWLASALDVEAGEQVLRASLLNEDEHGAFDLITTWLPLEVASPMSRTELETLGTWAALQKHGWKLTFATQSITAAAATADTAHTLGIDEGAPLLLLRRHAFIDSGRCVAVSDHRYPAGRVRLEVEFRGDAAASSADPPGLQIVKDSA